MADVRISALPTAQSPLTGTELVPIVQNGVTVQTTVNAVTQTPSLTATFLTVNQEPLLPNSRYFSAINGIQITDNGAQNPFTLSIVTNPTIPGNAGMAIPSGTTAQRNTTPAAIRFNSQTVAFEGFDGTNWVSFITNVAPPLITFSAGTTGLTPNTPTGGNIVLAGTLGVANGGTGLTSVTANRIPYGNGTSALQTSANLTFDGTTLTNTGNAIISDNSANAALRITQLGAGNALLVEDSANPDSTPFVIDSGGVVIAGTTTSVQTANPASGTVNTAIIQANGLISGTSSLGASAFFTSGSQSASVVLAKSNSGVIGTHTTVASGNLLGQLSFQGSDGTAFIRAADISASVDGTPGTNDMPGRLVFSTTADGASTPTERMRINSAGNVGIGAAPPDSRLHIRQDLDGTIRTIIQNRNATGTPIAELTFLTGAFSLSDDRYAYIQSAGGASNFLAFGTSNAGVPTERMRIANTGLVSLAATSGLSIGRTLVSAPAATDGNVFSGTYTPTLTNTTNIDASTAFVCQYMRVGNVVTVSGRVDIDPTAAGRIVLGMSLPIASNLAAATQAGGTFSSSGLATVNVGSISGDLTNDRATFDGVVAAIVNTGFHFSFTYLVV